MTDSIFFFETDSTASMDGVPWHVGFLDLVVVLMGVTVWNGLGVLTGVDFFLVEGLGKGAFFKGVSS